MDVTRRSLYWDDWNDELREEPAPDDGVESPSRRAVAALLGASGAGLLATAVLGVAGAPAAVTAALVVGGGVAVGFGATALVVYRLDERLRTALLEREGLVEELSQEFEKRDAALDKVRLGLGAARRRVARLEETLGNGRDDLNDIQQELDILERHVRSLADVLADEGGEEPRLFPNAQN